MKTLSILLLAATLTTAPALGAYAQGGDESRQYLSAAMEPIVQKKAAYYRTTAGMDGELYIGKTFTIEGKLKAEGTYRDADMTLPHGEFTFYHPNGRVESKGEYINGNKSGIWLRYDAWGEPLAEKIYNPEPLANIIYTRAQTMPQFNGGDDKALVRYVKSKVESASDKRVRGTYTSSFIVEKDGSLTEVKVVEGQDEKIGQQVVDAIKSTMPWSPGAEKGQPVRVQMRVPVQF
ncbi:MAG: energy transducer TonB [Flavobacteriales bacterium]|nr:energy transducer TonB [Flavobacteriales bacterium]